MCFSFKHRGFINTPDYVDSVSPRAFKEYDYTKTPDGTYLEESLRNSFKDDATFVQFVHKFYVSFMSNAQEFKVPYFVISYARLSKS